ncbi:MAG: Rpp14/Pop5 family protein [Nanoarchaeota archaeon]
MQPLKPSMKENMRYLYVKGKIDDIEKAILDFIGVLGMSKSSLLWIKKEKDYAIIGVNRESVNKVRASFAVWHEEIKVVRVSGTLKGLREK